LDTNLGRFVPEIERFSDGPEVAGAPKRFPDGA
jgi:hypothetical protein